MTLTSGVLPPLPMEVCIELLTLVENLSLGNYGQLTSPPTYFPCSLRCIHWFENFREIWPALLA